MDSLIEELHFKKFARQVVLIDFDLINSAYPEENKRTQCMNKEQLPELAFNIKLKKQELEKEANAVKVGNRNF